MNTIDEMIEVLQAYKEGKTIQQKTLKFCAPGLTDWEWLDTPNPRFDFYTKKYRIKYVREV